MFIVNNELTSTSINNRGQNLHYQNIQTCNFIGYIFIFICSSKVRFTIWNIQLRLIFWLQERKRHVFCKVCKRRIKILEFAKNCQIVLPSFKKWIWNKNLLKIELATLVLATELILFQYEGTICVCTHLISKCSARPEGCSVAIHVYDHLFRHWNRNTRYVHKFKRPHHLIIWSLYSY